MVSLVLVNMAIMVCDRVLYSTHKFAKHQSIKQKKKRAEELNEQLFNETEKRQESVQVPRTNSQSLFKEDHQIASSSNQQRRFSVLNDNSVAN